MHLRAFYSSNDVMILLEIFGPNFAAKTGIMLGLFIPQDRDFFPGKKGDIWGAGPLSFSSPSSSLPVERCILSTGFCSWFSRMCIVLKI